ncbi:uncharacterized protein LOC129770487 isoform X3 [Toxorhynchites rutilus septentrionalis]|uniref:uncharacterized protein LOC129770487 isoform X3 n=1 Tax=Toxorhynchites rutilus septentrionalis TaxID=329112 RepID=UPI0024789E74|nr:uncharacterized protein LOC129770487 isoform X3 [Toxorhynchites rutilus septentrionalis]
MDKIIILVLLPTLALNTVLVYGGNDGNPLKTYFGSHQWNPTTQWRRPVRPIFVDYQDNMLYDSTNTDDNGLDFSGTLQNIEKIVSKRTSHKKSRSLCDVMTTIMIFGNGTDGYEYRPDHYVSHTCMDSDNSIDSKFTCSEMGLHCEQRRQRIYITRRKVPSGKSMALKCWEQIKLEEIDSACECVY